MLKNKQTACCERDYWEKNGESVREDKSVKKGERRRKSVCEKEGECYAEVG